MAVALFSKDVEVHTSAVMVVLDTYPRMMVEIIANQWPPKQVLRLTRNDQSFMQKITPLQAKMISKLDVTGYSNLDVSCIYKLIRHFKLLPVPNQGWGNKPLKSDTKEEDDVERIRRYRNDILHRPRGGLSEQDGKEFFQDSNDMAKRLDISIGSPMNGFESQIKALQCSRVDRQTYMKALEKCAEYQAQLQETRDTPSVDLYYGNDIMMKLGSSDNQNASGDSQCSIYIRDQSLDVNAVIQKLEYIKKTLEKGPYNVIKLDGAENGSLILHISIPNRCFVSKETLHDSLQSFLHQFFLTTRFQCKTELPIVLAESDRYTTDDDEQDLEYLNEDPLPILKLNVNVQNSAFQNENVLYEEVNKFVSGMYDAVDSNGVPVNGSKREVMMFTGSENDLKGQPKDPDMDGVGNIVIHVKTDFHWRKFIMELCHGQIVQNMMASGLLPNLGSIFSLDEKRSIRSLERLGSPQKAMETLLDIFDKKDSEGKWQILKESLSENDYQWVIDFIEGDFVSYENTCAWTKLINVFKKALSANIRPPDILPNLTEKSIISDIDSEEVDKMYRMYGENEAVFQLLTYLPKRKPNIWYPEFINILYENGYAYVVKEIDPKKYEELQVHSSALFDSIDVGKTSEHLEADQLTMGYNTQEKFKSEKLDISKNDTSSNDRLAQDDGLNLHRFTMQELFIDEPDGSTNKKQLALTSQIHSSVSTRKDYDDDGLSLPKEPLILRRYQQELARPGLQGKNCIIVAPTGSGKTHVAVKIMQEHMSQIRVTRQPKVIFLIQTEAKARQQADVCIKYLPCKVKLMSGETHRNEKNEKVSEWLAKRDVLVVTAQILLNALIEQDVKIGDFTLMVFAECQHAHANHFYYQIMQAYMDQKIKHAAERNKLPMIVGLTASVGVGRAKTAEGAIDWIKTMMANMDAEELASVRDNIQELSEHVFVLEQVVKRSARRTKNYFGEAVGKIMEVTERYMKQSIYADGLGADKYMVLKAPLVKGSDQYSQWISNLWRETAKVINQEARRFLMTCRTYLDLYNRALIIYEDARVKDALDFLDENIINVKDSIIPNEIEIKMNTLYAKSRNLFHHCVIDVNHQNPKLDTLKMLIAKTFKENIDSRGVIIVKTRDVAGAIHKWIMETDGLKVLNPVMFVGSQISLRKEGMTNHDRDNILRYSRDGRHKLIITTSAADLETVLDIQKCNLIIKYDHVTNEIDMVQARGRGRPEGIRYYVVASEERMTAEKEELNMMREARMNQAIIHLQNFIQDDRQKFIQEIENLQLEANIQRELENATIEGRIDGDFEFEMRCGKCNEFICMSKDIKKIQAAHHAVIGEEIAEHINIIRMPKPTFEDDNIKMGCGKVNCKKCGKNLGNLIIYRKAQFPVLKIENFLVSDSHGNTSVYKKWKKSPFSPQELSSQNLLDRTRGVQYLFEQ